LPAGDIYVVKEGNKMASRENEGERRTENPESCNAVVPM
jgi:hypothetical protein